MKIELRKYPKDVLPPFINNSITTFLNSNLGIYEYISTNMMTSYGAILGSDYEVRRGSWLERPNLWVMYAANSGKGKSHQLEDITKPLLEKNNELIQRSKIRNAQIKEVEAMIKELNSRERKEPEKLRNVFESVFGSTDYFEPLNKYNMGGIKSLEINPLRLVYNTFTFPAILRQLERNEGRSLIIIVDEGKRMFEDMNKHSSGDEETFLEFFNYGGLTVDRKGDDLSSYIEDKTISMIVNTQPKVIGKIFNENRKANGNMYRWLFIYNNDEDASNPWDGNILETEPFNTFSEICKRRLRMWGEKQPRIFHITSEINVYLKTWRDYMNNKYRDLIEVDIYDSIMGKMDSYIIRFAIILNQLWNEQKYLDTGIFNNEFIMTIEDFKRAGELVEWHYIEHLKVTNQTESILNNYLSGDEIKQVYDKLQLTFKWADFVDGMELIGVNRNGSNYRLKKLVNNKIIRFNERDKAYTKIIL